MSPINHDEYSEGVWNLEKSYLFNINQPVDLIHRTRIYPNPIKCVECGAEFYVLPGCDWFLDESGQPIYLCNKCVALEKYQKYNPWKEVEYTDEEWEARWNKYG